VSTTLPPPLTGSGDSGASPPSQTTEAAGEDARPPGRPGWRPAVALMTATAVLGGAVTTGGLALTGALGGDGGTGTTTAVPASNGGSSDTSASRLDAKSIYASASPGVVEISATGTGSTLPNPFGRGSSPSTSTGSGFVVDGKGHIVTAAHVVDGATSIKVTFSDGTSRTATLAGKDDGTDVAVLKVDPSGLTLHPLALGSSASLEVGDAVVAIGSPFGYEESMSTGVVSGLDRTIQAPNGYTVAHAIQTDAALNPGNSGGPILDSSGRVIGIADQIATNGSSDQSSGVGFAVPIDLVADELDNLAAGQTVEHAYLGVSTTESTGATGALVGSVASGGPAASAGVKAGDVVTSIDGKRITGSSDLVAAIADRAPGDRVELTVRRGSETLTLTATLGTQPTRQHSPSAG
jgi:S1-C subfamily serine protease